MPDVPQVENLRYGMRPRFKPTGRDAAGEPRLTPHLVMVRPTPHGVGLGRRPREALGGDNRPKYTRQDSNLQPSVPKTDALSIELRARVQES